MPKILFIITQSELGGAQRYIFETAKYFNSQNYYVLVGAGQGDKNLFEKLGKVKIQSHFIKYLIRNPNPFKDFLAIFEILNLIKKEKPDILFLNSTKAGFLGSIAGWLYKKLYYHKLPIIYRAGGWSFNDPRCWFLNKILFWMEKITAPLKDKIIVNSGLDYNIAIKKRIASSLKMIKIYNGIDAKKLDFLSKEQAIKYLSSKFKIQNSKLKFKVQNYDYKIIGTVANFYKTKGLEYLIKSAYILKNQISNLIFIVIGDGKLRPKLETLIKTYNLENNFFLIGKIPDAYRYLKAFDIFILPSLKEGMPWAILEAMSAEIPIIATKVGAIPEMIENKKEGLITPPKNSNKLAKNIIWILEHQKQAQFMATNARKKIEKEFTLQKMLNKTENLITSLIR